MRKRTVRVTISFSGLLNAKGGIETNSVQGLDDNHGRMSRIAMRELNHLGKVLNPFKPRAALILQ